MMAMTHALAGLLLGALVLPLAPALGPTALAAGFLGGLAPDLDLFATHRRTFHFPVYGPPVTALLAIPAVFNPGNVTVFVTVFAGAAALHAAMDVAGGGLGLEPWRNDDDRAVYSHALGRWLYSRGPIEYDGAPADLLLALAVGLPLLAALSGPLDLFVAVLLGTAAAYTVVRKRLVGIVAVLLRVLPRPLWNLLPPRMLEAARDG